MTEVIVKIVVEVLSILALATKEVKQGQTKKYLKKLAGRTDIEDGLQSLDRLIQEEVRMATAEVFKVTHEVEEIVTGVDVRVKEVDDDY
ncbi:hypothetical protein B0F90DRAFT_1764144 [Multifurca ochricompacta]|uniref:Uncharacterized protein n=1 Tax=Multifurca ochricompacta TaxID=376703 RepID=A0AAD4LWS4_9AGAM|nr:hypothetical protein B0F90DRAFT_1764144 [Multifurca ochricompacta]